MKTTIEKHLRISIQDGNSILKSGIVPRNRNETFDTSYNLDGKTVEVCLSTQEYILLSKLLQEFVKTLEDLGK